MLAGRESPASAAALPPTCLQVRCADVQQGQIRLRCRRSRRSRWRWLLHLARLAALLLLGRLLLGRIGPALSLCGLRCGRCSGVEDSRRCCRCRHCRQRCCRRRCRCLRRLRRHYRQVSAAQARRHRPAHHALRALRAQLLVLHTHKRQLGLLACQAAALQRRLQRPPVGALAHQAAVALQRRLPARELGLRLGRQQAHTVGQQQRQHAQVRGDVGLRDKVKQGLVRQSQGRRAPRQADDSGRQRAARSPLPPHLCRLALLV